MQISPPILFPRQDNEDYAAWVMRTMPVISHRAYPVNGVNSWHGGIHIPHTDTGALANPLRAVADGVIVYANDPAPVEKRDRKPLNYDGKTDNGCVLIRHEMLIGDDPVLCVFYSLTMHMKQVRPEIQGKVGMRVRRGQVIGTSGMVSGANAYHFQMCCPSEMLKRLCGREQGNLDVSAPGEERTAYGHRYFFFLKGPRFMREVRLMRCRHLLAASSRKRSISPMKGVRPALCVKPMVFTQAWVKLQLPLIIFANLRQRSADIKLTANGYGWHTPAAKGGLMCHPQR